MRYIFWKERKQRISTRYFKKKRKKYFYQELTWQEKTISTKKDTVTKKEKLFYQKLTRQKKSDPGE